MPNAQRPPILEYGDPRLAGPEPFDRFMGTVLYLISGICAVGVLVVIGVILIRHRWTPMVFLSGGVGILLLTMMSMAMLRAGRAIRALQRRQG